MASSPTPVSLGEDREQQLWNSHDAVQRMKDLNCYVLTAQTKGKRMRPGQSSQTTSTWGHSHL